ncbi:NAD(P)-dependent oxidoreductase [Gordonia aurantiaca]|uniref:NAD(P)-dependent oxidoreductase n=1 Tax=Gordonia sp. B21 TaxID=3151852 RepID=UPI0032645E37
MGDRVGFLGLGRMGSAMAANLHRRTPLVVWNRTRSSCDGLGAVGATVASVAADVFADAEVVFVMLSDEDAVESVLGSMDAGRFRDRIVVLMSTVSPAFSERLEGRIVECGGAYVEAPVSGSRQPALDGTLLSLTAGDEESLDRVEPLIRAMSSTVVRCGRVPSALMTKLAVNAVLIPLVTALAEAFHFAEENGVDPGLLRQVLDAGPMSSAVSRAKTAKLVEADWTPHAAIHDVLKNSTLVREHAHRNGVVCPLLDVCTELYAEATELGRAEQDMAAVIYSLRHRTWGRI